MKEKSWGKCMEEAKTPEVHSSRDAYCRIVSQAGNWHPPDMCECASYHSLASTAWQCFPVFF